MARRRRSDQARGAKAAADHHGRGRTVQAAARELNRKRHLLPGFDSAAIATMHGLASKCCLGYRKVGIEIGVNYAVSARD